MTELPIVLADFSADPQIKNGMLDFRNIDLAAKPAKQVVAIQAIGTWTGGSIPLLGSVDGVNFAALKDGADNAIVLSEAGFLFLEPANIVYKLDLSGVTSSNLLIKAA